MSTIFEAAKALAREVGALYPSLHDGSDALFVIAAQRDSLGIGDLR